MLTQTVHFRVDKKTYSTLRRIAKLHRRKAGDLIRQLILQEDARLDGQNPGNGELAKVQPDTAAEGRREAERGHGNSR